MTSKRQFLGLTAAAALLALAGGMTLASGTAEAQQRELYIYNWSDYIGVDTIANFEKETGIKVTYDLFDGYETMDARLQAGSSGYDVVFPGRYYISQHVKQGRQQRLEHAADAGNAPSQPGEVFDQVM